MLHSDSPSQALAERVVTVISQSTQIPIEDIGADSSIDELDIDSLGFLAIVSDLEEAFGVEIPNERAFEITSIPELVACLQQILSDAPETPVQDDPS